jgi:hypothetical protein
MADAKPANRLERCHDPRTTCAIRVEGHLDDHWRAWVGALDLPRDDDDATTIRVLRVVVATPDRATCRPSGRGVTEV